MGAFDDMRKKAKQLAEDHPDQVERGSDAVIEQAGDRFDRATGGRHAAHTDKAQRAADDKIGERDR
jgi:hypothetical protein